MLPYSAFDDRTSRASHPRNDLFNQLTAASIELPLNQPVNQPVNQSTWYSPALSFAVQPPSQDDNASDQLIISEYVEGSGYHKAIEITISVIQRCR